VELTSDMLVTIVWNLGTHPIFGRDCYKQTTSTTGGDEVPATTDEAVMA